MPVRHLTASELEAGLGHIRQSPADRGLLQMIVRRPRTEEREILREGRLDPACGLEGDNWLTRDGSKAPDPAVQITIMNARAIALIADDPRRWHLAGDQLFVDFDLSAVNLPAGTRLAIGDAIVEVSLPPHTGCRKFTDRFGLDAMKFVNSPAGRELNLRGINARVIQAGTVRVGDAVVKVG